MALHDYVLSDVGGKETNLAPYKGRVLVVEMFATWCPPCRKDLPEIAALQAGYPTDKVAFVAVSADGASETLPALPKFLKEMDLKIPVLVGGGIFVDRFAGVDKPGGRQVVLPQTYVFDGAGEIVARYVGENKNKKKSLTDQIDRMIKGEAK
ncbi:MAG TPA: TlpA disulfide reductase family protein [Candidatus Polarisedimenticolia bacterium]|nr:TlpA disulfide reductase family protein [Candidatus Polarisedimenticolia bacterium]